VLHITTPSHTQNTIFPMRLYWVSFRMVSFAILCSLVATSQNLGSRSFSDLLKWRCNCQPTTSVLLRVPCITILSQADICSPGSFGVEYRNGPTVRSFENGQRPDCSIYHIRTKSLNKSSWRQLTQLLQLPVTWTYIPHYWGLDIFPVS
jgi:hypothetical protein